MGFQVSVARLVPGWRAAFATALPVVAAVPRPWRGGNGDCGRDGLPSGGSGHGPFTMSIITLRAMLLRCAAS